MKRLLLLTLLAGCRQLFGIEDGATVVDAPGAQLPTVGFAAASTHVDEPSGTIAIEVGLDAPADGPITVAYTAVDGSAERGLDYAFEDGTLTFAPGETVKTIECTIAEDNLDESDERFTIALAEPSGAILGASTHEVKISAIALPRVSFTMPASSMPEGQNVIVVVQVDRPSPAPLQVGYTVGGTATSGADFQPLAGTLAIAAGATSAQITLQTINDTFDEDPETVVLTLTGGPGVVVGTVAARSHQIEDNDPLPQLQFANSNESAPEGQVVSARLRLSPPSGRSVTFSYATINGTTATADVDYTFLVPSPVTIPAGEHELMLPIQTIDDGVPENEEFVRIRLELATNAQIGLSDTFELKIR